MRPRGHIRDIPDFPQAGDRLQGHHAAAARPDGARRGAIDAAGRLARGRADVDFVVAAEARGFILGARGRARAGRRLRARPQAGQAAARDGRRPSTSSSTASTRSRCTPTRSRSGARVLVHDDLLATGGTARALCELVERPGGSRGGCAFLVELAFLGGPRAARGLRRPRAARLRRRVMRRARSAHAWPRRPSDVWRWWATRTACRAGGRGVTRVEDVDREAWTDGARAPQGHARAGRLPRRRGARARAARAGRRSSRGRRSSAMLAEAAHRGSSSQPDGERHARDARRCASARAAGRASAPLQLRARRRGARLDEALDGLERAAARRRVMRWWGWGEDGARVVAARAAPRAAARRARRRPAPPRGAGGARRTCGCPSRRCPRRRAPRWRPPWAPSTCATTAPRASRTPRQVLPRPACACARATLRGAPDAVVAPGSTATRCAAVLAACAERAASRWCPFGGGTSVVGGVEPVRERLRGAWCRSTSGRLDRLLDVDRALADRPRSSGGLLGPEAERAARRARAARSATSRRATSTRRSAAGWPPARPARPPPATAASTSWWRACGWWRPAGELDHARACRPRAAGPDLRELVVGSEGVLGVITRGHAAGAPARRARAATRAGRSARFAEGCEALRVLEQAGARPTWRGSPTRTRRGCRWRWRRRQRARERLGRAYLRAARPRGRLPGDRRASRARRTTSSAAGARRARCCARAAALRARPAAGRGLAAQPLPRPLPARRPARPRRDGRDAGDRDHVDATWTRSTRAVAARCARARGARHAAARDVPRLAPLPSGASLYFTFLARQDATTPLGAVARAPRRAACDAIVAAGGTITHHHAVGRDHRRGCAPRSATLGVELLRAAKERLDPAGIMNPGKLLPARTCPTAPSAIGTVPSSGQPLTRAARRRGLPLSWPPLRGFLGVPVRVAELRAWPRSTERPECLLLVRCRSTCYVTSMYL